MTPVTDHHQSHARGGSLSLAEITRKLLEQGHVSETVTLKMSAKLDTLPEVCAVAHDGETLLSAAERAFDVYCYLLAKFVPAVPRHTESEDK